MVNVVEWNEGGTRIQSDGCVAILEGKTIWKSGEDHSEDLIPEFILELNQWVTEIIWKREFQEKKKSKYKSYEAGQAWNVPGITGNKCGNRVKRGTEVGKTAKGQNKQGPAGQDKVFGFYFECVGKSLEGFSKRMTRSHLTFAKDRSLPFWGLPPLSKQSPFLEAVSRSPRITQSLPGPPAVACSVGTLIIITP